MKTTLLFALVIAGCVLSFFAGIGFYDCVIEHKDLFPTETETLIDQL